MPRELDQTFHIIIEKMIATGQAPHYTEIATALGVSPERGRKTLRKLFASLGFQLVILTAADTSWRGVAGGDDNRQVLFLLLARLSSSG